MNRRARAASIAVAVLAGWGLLGVPQASATVVERVVAVVGEDALWLTDLRTRARPYLARIDQQIPTGAQRSAAISQLYGMLVERLIEEQLQEHAARKAQVVVTAEEIDSGIQRVAAQNGITEAELVAEAKRSGMDVVEYRKEIRRQVLEAKLLNMRLQGRVNITEQDLRTAYRKLVMQERQQLPFVAAWIVLKAPAEAGQPQVARVRERAEWLAQQARKVPFEQLAQRFSEDPISRQAGGRLAQMKPGSLAPPVDRVLLGMEPGEVSAPVHFGGQFFVLKLLERQGSALPSFEEAAPQLQQQVHMAKMDEARQRWMRNLRRTTHIDIRM